MAETTISGVDSPAGVVDTSFAAFLRTAAGQGACGEDLIARLMPLAGTINSLPGLLRWARERHPEMFPAQDWRAPLPISAAPFGSQAMKRIWSRYLQWREAS